MSPKKKKARDPPRRLCATDARLAPLKWLSLAFSCNAGLFSPLDIHTRCSHATTISGLIMKRQGLDPRRWSLGTTSWSHFR